MYLNRENNYIDENPDIHLKGALVHGGANTTMDITAGYDVNVTPGESYIHNEYAILGLQLVTIGGVRYIQDQALLF